MKNALATALAIAEASAVGEVQRADPDGAALWITPEAAPQDRAFHAAQRRQALQALLGPVGFSNFVAICEAMEHQLPPALADAWYLSILGVRPEARGQGLAQRLLAPTLARADACGAVCYLETFNPLSLPFYRRLGFTDETPCREPVTARDYWLLARPARSPRRASTSNGLSR